MEKVSLVIFTCEGREYLLKKTYKSFLSACNFQFDEKILAIDGKIDTSIIEELTPDLVIYGIKRKGYVISIKNAIIHIKTDYFFWLEDDWTFRTTIDVPFYIALLSKHTDWVEIVYSKHGPLTDNFKTKAVGENMYQNVNGYSANPSFNKTSFLLDGFKATENAPKMEGTKEIGFENFLTAYFNDRQLKCVLIDPVDHLPIKHEGYLETTARNWHMMSSIEKKTEKHLLVFPTPSFARRLYMILKLGKTMAGLAFRQLFNDEIYDLSFRIVAQNMSTMSEIKKSAAKGNKLGDR